MNELMKTACPYKFSERSKSDINFDPRITGEAEGVEAETDRKKVMCIQQQQHANLGQKSLSAGTQRNEGWIWCS